MHISASGSVEHAITLDNGCEDMSSINDSPQYLITRLIIFCLGLYPITTCPMVAVSRFEIILK